MRPICNLIVIFAMLGFIHCKDINRKAPKEKKHHYLYVSGAYALYPLAQAMADEYQQTNTHLRISIFPSSSTKGMTDVTLKKADLGMYSKDLTGEPPSKIIYLKIAIDAVVAVTNRNNPFLDQIQKHGVTKTQFADIFCKQSVDNWGQLCDIGEDAKITVFTRSDLCGATNIWSEFLICDQEDLEGIGVYGDPGMINAIKTNPLGIGFLNMKYVFDCFTGEIYDGLAIIPIDFNSNGSIDHDESFYNNLGNLNEAIREKRYPFPLARDLFFLVNPDCLHSEALQYLDWVFNEGQNMITKTGYLAQPETVIQRQQKIIKQLINKLNQ
jgi:phosphate transport system substrate-binding protein